MLVSFRLFVHKFHANTALIVFFAASSKGETQTGWFKQKSVEDSFHFFPSLFLIKPYIERRCTNRHGIKEVAKYYKK